MAETLGSLIDKICIAELKIYHTQEQIDRQEIADDLRQLCRDRLVILNRQRNDLVIEFDDLCGAWSNRTYQPKVYRQFKMYNDPRFRLPQRA